MAPTPGGDEMTERLAEASPRCKARIAGVLYLVIILTATFAELYVREGIVVYRDAATTASNILAREPLYRLGGVAMLVALVSDVALALIFYQLFKPVSKTVSLMAAAFRLMDVAILAVNLLNHFAPLILLRGAQPGAFTPDQLQALSLASLRFYAQGFNLGMVFFGFDCLLMGYLIFRSTFLPRILGGLMALAGLSYLTNSFANFLSPAWAANLFPYVLAPPFIAEASLALWLLLIGLNAQRWREQASAVEGRQW